MYDFSLKFEEASSPKEQKRATFDFFSSSIFSQIQKQLGLQLEADKAPVDYLIVDHVEEPAPN
jgi:uncharacterized protein (TIGR03435 family)